MVVECADSLDTIQLTESPFLERVLLTPTNARTRRAPFLTPGHVARTTSKSRKAFQTGMSFPLRTNQKGWSFTGRPRLQSAARIRVAARRGTPPHGPRAERRNDGRAVVVGLAPRRRARGCWPRRRCSSPRVRGTTWANAGERGGFSAAGERRRRIHTWAGNGRIPWGLSQVVFFKSRRIRSLLEETSPGFQESRCLVGSICVSIPFSSVEEQPKVSPCTRKTGET